MNRAVITRIINWRTAAAYLAIFLLLIMTAPKGVSITELLGGFSVIGGMRRLNILGIIRWNLCVLPPVAVGILFMSSELGPLSTYTVMRTASIKTWYLVRLCAVILANLIYISTFIFLGAAFGLNARSEPFRLYQLMLVFPMHTILMSSISVMMLTVCRSSKAAIFSYFAVEGGMVIWGSLFPDISKYLLPFWGMAQSEGLLLSNRGYHLLIMVGMTVLVFILLTSISIKWLQSNNPVASPRNI